MGSVSLKHIIKLIGCELSQTDECHVDGFIVRLGCKLILLFLIIQVGNVVVTDTRGFVILSTEEHTGLCQVDKRNHIRFLLHKLILSKLVVGDQVTELVLKVFNFLTLATGTVDMHLVVVFLRENFIHAHVEYSQRSYDFMRRLEDTVVGKDKGEDESDKNA